MPTAKDAITSPEKNPAVTGGAPAVQKGAVVASGATGKALHTYESTVLASPLDPRTPDMRRHIVRLRALLRDSG